MDERVFGPPPNTEDRDTGKNPRTVAAFQQPLTPERPTRSSLRRLLLNGRRRRRTRP
ncbi:hypothetical protein [Streptomyces sp. NBC_00878]|uniref:hypothetical protein n=1 Tax=Streptomyces sp. NBC_00878 TaxID=2975854 RepID=UPI00224EA933|nr:hypothetical protein [Streptomyces sp. NBC_00878]MCX4911821.1 hypothetical protein [Streptomyces sp. NBC_00878]